MSSQTKDDEYIADLIATCASLAQVYCNRLLSSGEVLLCVENYSQFTQLWGGGAKSITSVTATDINNVEVIISDFTFNPVTQKLTIPYTNNIYFNFMITYAAGYVTLPPQVKHAVLLMISTMYNNRDDYVTGLTDEKIPYSSIALLNTVKHYVA